MNFLTMVSNLLIKPLELVLESVFFLVLYVTNNISASIFLLSLILSLFALPLYKKADDWRGSISLVLEIPFFMAAWQFFSGLQILRGVSFGPIQDLSQPDALLCICGVTIHVLPILMTLIHLVSGYIYTRGVSVKIRLLQYGMAAVFLVLLYQAPSALAVYWTLKTLFALVKNIVFSMAGRNVLSQVKRTVCKVRIPRKYVSLFCSLLGIAVFVLFLVHPVHRIRHFIAVLSVLALLQVPAVKYYCLSRGFLEKTAASEKKETLSFLLGCVFLAVLTGLHIPGAVIANAPEAFARLYTQAAPLQYLLMTLLISCGFFIIWAWIFYKLSGPGSQRVMSSVVWIFSGIAVIDYIFFGRNYGNLSAYLIFDVTPALSKSEVLVNLAVILAAGILLFVIWGKKKNLIPAAYIAAILVIAGMTLVQIPKIQKNAGFQVQESLSQKEELPDKFICYSFLKTAPVLVQPFIYNNGSYMDPDSIYVDASGQRTGSIPINRLCRSLDEEASGA